MPAASSPLAAQGEWLAKYRYALRLSEQGTVVSVGDGIAWISGLPSARMDEIVQLEDGSSALVFHLARNRIGAILLRGPRHQMHLAVPIAVKMHFAINADDILQQHGAFFHKRQGVAGDKNVFSMAGIPVGFRQMEG